MKKSLLINAALLAAVVLLGLVAWFKPSSGTPSFALASLKATDVKSLEVVIGGSTPLLFARGERGWELAQPFAGRGDPVQIQKLLELLDAKSSVRLPAEGLARYGLTVNDVDNAIGQSMSGASTTSFYDADRRFDVVVRLAQPHRDRDRGQLRPRPGHGHRARPPG